MDISHPNSTFSIRFHFTPDESVDCDGSGSDEDRRYEGLHEGGNEEQLSLLVESKKRRRIDGDSAFPARALKAFRLYPDKWGVNVHPYSCTSANFAVYTGVLLPKDRIMGLDSPSGGHVSHGYCMPSGKKVSDTSIFFESLSYKVNPLTGYIDYDKLEEKAVDYCPKILICCGSSYPREWDYARFRQIANRCGAILMCDMAHISGLVAVEECLSPFDYCDIVTSTTHKMLRGPRGGIIFYRKGRKLHKHENSWQADESEHYDIEERINFAVFPSLQGVPHNNHIAALTISFKQVTTPEYRAYIQQVRRNAQALAVALLRRKCRLVTGGTDNQISEV